jgi:hypothetical protein
MPDVHAIILLGVAPKVAEMFRTDPHVAELLDPAIYVAADADECVVTVANGSELTKLIPDWELTHAERIDDESPRGAPIMALVMDESGVTIYRLPDPRTAPEVWPWMGLEDDEE